MPKKFKGFTLIELLIVIAIIAILAAIVFVALDPLTRFKDARDSRRWADASAILSAIKINQVDKRGSYTATVQGMATGTVYMIGTAVTGCTTTPATLCTVQPASTTACINLTQLVTDGYLGTVPVSPNGAGSWSAATTGYTIQKDSTGIVTIRACENENTAAISVVR